MTRRRVQAVSLLALLLFFLPQSRAQTPPERAAASRLIGEVFANGQQLNYVSALSDRIGSRLTGTANARRAEEWAEGEMKRLGLVNVRREPYRMAASWERGPASAALVSGGNNRPLAVASYTWTPGTEGPVEGEVVDVGAGRAEDVRRVAAQVKGRVALVVPEGADLDSVIYNFYRAAGLVRELKDAGALAVLLAADKPHSILYTAPVEFTATGKLAALPTVSLAREDVLLLRRLFSQNLTPRIRLDVRNRIGGGLHATKVLGERRGPHPPDELVVVGAHPHPNDPRPRAPANRAGPRPGPRNPPTPHTDHAPPLPPRPPPAATPDQLAPRDRAPGAPVFASPAHETADRPQRSGRRHSADKMKRMADETKVGEQWRAAGIWK